MYVFIIFDRDFGAFYRFESGIRWVLTSMDEAIECVTYLNQRKGYNAYSIHAERVY